MSAVAVGRVSAHQALAMIIPLYIYPGSTWTQVRTAKASNPTVPIIAVINPSNGVGTFDPVYQSSILQLRQGGVVVLGYIDTARGAISSASVQAAMRSYMQWYGVDGVFLDNMNNASGVESYYASLTAYAKSIGMTFTVGNAGTDTLPSYVGTVDNIVIHENAFYPSLTASWRGPYARSNFSTLVYGSPLDFNQIKAMSNFVGYVYVTDNPNASNPWNTLPPYFANEVAALVGL